MVNERSLCFCADNEDREEAVVVEWGIKEERGD